MNPDRIGGASRIALLLVFLLLLAPPPASARVEGPCQVFVQEEDLSASESPTVQPTGNGTLRYHIIAESDVLRWTVKLHYGPFDRTVLDRAFPPGSNEENGTMSVAEYTQYGTGLYEVTGTAQLADGTTCTATMRLQVSGSLFDSVLGLAAVAVLGAAGVGLLLTILQVALDAKDVVEAAKDFIEQAKHAKP
jgi:hypothetical protein